MVITHHPLIFSGVKSVNSNTLLYKAVSSGITFISCHTNLDIANDGVNDCLANVVGIKNISSSEDEFLKIGEISDPFTMIDRKGKEICAIVKLKTRIDGHKATITEDYQRLKSIVQEKLGEEKLQKWILEKQKSTYVRINEDWVKCDFKYPGWIKK